MTAAEHKRFLIYYLSSNILSLVFVKAGGETVYVSKKIIVNTEIFFFTLFFQEKGGSVGGEPPPPPVVDYLTISCRRRLGRTSNHFV